MVPADPPLIFGTLSDKVDAGDDEQAPKTARLRQQAGRTRQRLFTSDVGSKAKTASIDIWTDTALELLCAADRFDAVRVIALVIILQHIMQ